MVAVAVIVRANGSPLPVEVELDDDTFATVAAAITPAEQRTSPQTTHTEETTP